MPGPLAGRSSMRAYAREFVDNDGRLSMLLFAVFSLLYIFQVPEFAANADAIVYYLRSQSELPILGYAFLDGRVKPDSFPLPNYHLGHTILLWLAYQISPASVSNGAWLAGCVSAICGGASVALSFLIWRQLNFTRIVSVCAAIVAGFIPAIWYQSTIGEIYALQLSLSLLFILLFLRELRVLAALTFLAAVLVSPLAGLSFFFLFLAPWTKRNLIHALMLGGAALASYLTIFLVLDSNILMMFDAIQRNSLERPAGWNTGKFIIVLLANIGLLVGFLIAGCWNLFNYRRTVLIALGLAIIPQIVLAFVATQFLRELGCFLLLLFWAASLPIAIGISNLPLKLWKPVLAVAGSALLLMTFWIAPNYQLSTDRAEAGQWLVENVPDDIKVLGDWNNAVTLTIERFGWEKEALTTNLFEAHRPETKDALSTGEHSLIVVAPKRHAFRHWLGALPIESLQVKKYNPVAEIRRGTVTKIFENGSLSLYLWNRPMDKDVAFPALPMRTPHHSDSWDVIPFSENGKKQKEVQRAGV